jgi:hypothetical protein
MTLDPSYLSTASAREQAFVRSSQPDYWQWLSHVSSAAGCSRPIRLAGSIEHVTVRPDGAWSYTSSHTADMPDGLIYKACGTRRESVCPSCAKVYQRDAYQLLRVGLVGGKGVPETVATHPCLFVTFTAPGFGAVHTRPVPKHTCESRRRCDCRPQPCHPGRTAPCPHGKSTVCFARHQVDDQVLGVPLCLDCYDHHRQVVWNNQARELWRRTTVTMLRAIRRTAKQRALNPLTVRLGFGNVAEMQRRGVVHFHAIIRLDGTDPDYPDAILPPPDALTVADLIGAVEHSARAVMFATAPHPVMPNGWVINWGSQLDVRTINLGTDGEITDGMVAGYLAKYATKSTEAAGLVSGRLTHETIDVFANPQGSHVERLVDACWRLGGYVPGLRLSEQAERPHAGLRRWTHMLGFGGHFLTKSRRYSVTFRVLRDARVIWRRTLTAGPEVEDPVEAPTVLVVNFLQFVGVGWHTAGDALLANTAAAMARERQRAAREELTHAGSR